MVQWNDIWREWDSLWNQHEYSRFLGFFLAYSYRKFTELWMNILNVNKINVTFDPKTTDIVVKSNKRCTSNSSWCKIRFFFFHFDFVRQLSAFQLWLNRISKYVFMWNCGCGWNKILTMTSPAAWDLDFFFC